MNDLQKVEKLGMFGQTEVNGGQYLVMRVQGGHIWRAYLGLNGNDHFAEGVFVPDTQKFHSAAEVIKIAGENIELKKRVAQHERSAEELRRLYDKCVGGLSCIAKEEKVYVEIDQFVRAIYEPEAVEILEECTGLNNYKQINIGFKYPPKMPGSE